MGRSENLADGLKGTVDEKLDWRGGGGEGTKRGLRISQGNRVMLFTKAESIRRKRGYVQRHQLPALEKCGLAACGTWALVQWDAGRVGLSRHRSSHSGSIWEP